MHVNLRVPHLQPIVSLVAGVLILVRPKLLNYVLPSVPTMLRQRAGGSLPLRAEVTASDGYARFAS